MSEPKKVLWWTTDGAQETPFRPGTYPTGVPDPVPALCAEEFSHYMHRISTECWARIDAGIENTSRNLEASPW